MKCFLKVLYMNDEYGYGQHDAQSFKFSVESCNEKVPVLLGNAQKKKFTQNDVSLFKVLHEMRIPVKLNSDSGICEHHFRKVCGQGFFEQKLSFEGRHLFDSPNKPAAKRSAAIVDPRRWNRTVHLASEYVH